MLSTVYFALLLEGGIYFLGEFVCYGLSTWENYPLLQFSAEKKSFSISSSVSPRDGSLEEAERGMGS